MLHKIRKKKAQSTAEYAIMLGLVIAAVVAMQIFIQRAIKGKMFDASHYLTTAGANTLRSDSKATAQYEPDYVSSEYTSSRDSSLTVKQDAKTLGQESALNSVRRGHQKYTYTMNQVTVK